IFLEGALLVRADAVRTAQQFPKIAVHQIIHSRSSSGPIMAAASFLDVTACRRRHQGLSLMLKPARITPTVSECPCALSVSYARYSSRADIVRVSLPSPPSPWTNPASVPPPLTRPRPAGPYTDSRWW